MTNDDDIPNSPWVEIEVEPLEAGAFARFGSVIEAPARQGEDANGGTGMRWRDVARIDTTEDAGEVDASIYRAFPRSLPFLCDRLERHPLSSQLFLPIGGRPFLVIVAEGGPDRPDALTARAFLTDGRQGVNYARGVWHHPLIGLGEDSDFLVVGRRGPGRNFDLVGFQNDARLRVTAGAASQPA